MVHDHGLSVLDQRAYEAALGDHYVMRSRIEILTLEHKLVADVSSAFNDGQVNFAAGDVRRSATVQLFDPTYSIGLDSDAPSAGAVAPIYMLRCWRGIYVDALARWVDTPLLTGPLIRPSRDGDLLSIEVQSKEHLAMDLAWRTVELKKGMNQNDAIRKVMGDGCGERFFKLSPTTAKLSKDITLSRDKTPREVAASIAAGGGRTFYYDGLGYLVVKPRPVASAYTFSTGPGGVVKTAAKVGYNETTLKNLAYVTGGTPKGKKSPATGFAVAPASHPLSPQSLIRGGVPRFLREDISADSVDSDKEAKALAKRRLPGLLLQSGTVAFDCMPVWHLDEGDYATHHEASTGVLTRFSWTDASIPLTAAGSQSVGFNARVSKPRRTFRR